MLGGFICSPAPHLWTRQPARCCLLGGGTFRARSCPLVSRPHLRPHTDTATSRSCRPSAHARQQLPVFLQTEANSARLNRALSEVTVSQAHAGAAGWGAGRLPAWPARCSLRPLCGALAGRGRRLAGCTCSLWCLSKSRPGRQRRGPGSVCACVCARECVCMRVRACARVCAHVCASVCA